MPVDEHQTRRRGRRSPALPLHPVRAPKTPRLREVAYDAIKEAILDGRLASGQPLQEESIAELLQISRTPVREALALLEHEALISPRAGKGLWVRRLSRHEFVDMFVANETVEPYLARLASMRVTSDHAEAMRAVVEDCRVHARLPDVAGFLRDGRRFHQVVGEASGNPVLTRFVVQNEERTDIYLLGNAGSVEVDAWEPSVREHEAIMEAIVRREPEEAARLVIYHSQSVRHRLAPLFTEDAPGEEEAS